MSSETPIVLFVDDDADVLTSAQVLLGRNGWRMLQARSPAEAWSVLAADRPDVILLDLNFSRGATSGEEGFRWLAEVRAHDPEAVVVVVTGHSGVNIAVAAMKAGASDFVMKPWSNARLLDTLRDALALGRRRDQASEPATAEAPALILGESPAIARVADRIARAAPTDAAVLIHGAAGTGKSLAAQVLHARSPRAAQTLARLDLRSLVADPATIDKALADAAGGTLVLDEIAALPAGAQGELLAALDRGVDVRLVVTTRDLEAARATVRDDLLARLGVVEIRMPPLAERGEDAVLLVEHFVRLFARRHGRPPKPLDETAIVRLTTEPPPGEVRGLRQAAERAVVLSEADILTAADFAPAEPPGRAAAAGPDFNLARTERAAVEAALKRHAHNVTQAARDLGLTRAALYRRMLKHGL
ncbi:MAG: sigma-54-dependent Fis family transcriptional regulator [Phenylobacterium sp.]|nr:MAG: sigma-54-dependent Fis family transcriptional regulator [Phenylobacterium sp.]